MVKYMGFMEGMMCYHPKSDTGFKYMDWEKAKHIVKNNPKAKIYAGLQEDWGYTSGLIYDNGEYYDGGMCFYGCSYWATPILMVDGREVPCWTNESDVPSDKVPEWWGDGAKLHRWDDEDPIY